MTERTTITTGVELSHPIVGPLEIEAAEIQALSALQQHNEVFAEQILPITERPEDLLAMYKRVEYMERTAGATKIVFTHIGEQ